MASNPVFIIAVGVLGFAVGICSDISVLKKWSKFVPAICWLGVAILQGYAHPAIAFVSPQFPLSIPLIWIGWFCLVLGIVLLTYSLFLEIPFSKTYVKSEERKQLVHVGTYALTRHPGVLWYALLLIGLILASRSTWALVAAPIWFAMEVLWIWIEDRYIFEKTITGYDEYKRSTPMVVPTWASARRCWRTLALRRLFAGAGSGDDVGRT